MRRREALKAGLLVFIPDVPCKRGHLTSRHVEAGCLACAKLRKQTPEYKMQEGARQRGKRRKNAPERAARVNARYHEDPRTTMLWHARRRAKAAGVAFNIDKSDIVIPATCPALGIPLFPGRKRSGPNSPSLDRIRPARGYVKGNVAVVSQRANQIKNDASPIELRAVLEWLERQ